MATIPYAQLIFGTFFISFGSCVFSPFPTTLKRENVKG